MKSLIQAVAIAAALAIPAVSFAQSSQPLTRAEVKAELIRVEAAGYNPATANSYDYPANIQRAEARVAAQNGTDEHSYGGTLNTTSASGVPVQSTFGDSVQSVYHGH